MFNLWFPQLSTVRKLILLKAAGVIGEVWKTIIGAIVSFTTAIAAPVRSLVVAIEPVQSGSGDPAPDNVRPITGWTAANVVRTGANIWGGEKMADDMVAAINNSNCQKGSDEFGDYVKLTAGSGINKKVFQGPFKENTRYTVIFKARKSATNQSTNMIIAYTDGTSGYLNFPSPPATGTVYTFALPSTAGKTVAYISGVWSSGTCFFYYDGCGIFEGVLTTEDFEAYTGTTIPIAFPDSAGTVYGGTLDVTNGALTVTMAIVQMSSLSWAFSGNRFRASPPSESASPRINGINAVCSCYKKTTATVGGNFSFYANDKNYSSSKYFVVFDNRYSTKADFEASLTGQTIAYELETPQTYQLTPTEISTLLGSNTIWADTGNVTVEYRES